MIRIPGTKYMINEKAISHVEKVSADNFTLYLSGGVITGLTKDQIKAVCNPD